MRGLDPAPGDGREAGAASASRRPESPGPGAAPAGHGAERGASGRPGNAPVGPDPRPGVTGQLLRWLAAALMLGVMAGGGHWFLQREAEYLPVRVVTVDGQVRRLSRERLEETVIGHLNGGILTQDLEALKSAVEALPWVRSASLRRIWPDRLELAVVEHEPLSRWGDAALVTADGVVFRPPIADFPPGLPRLAGSDERAPEVVRRYLDLAPRFVARGLAIDNLECDARGAWSARLAQGFTLALGKLEVDERARRFLRAYPSLAAAGRPATVDMRYSNGLTVVWAGAAIDESPTVESGPKGGKRLRNRS